MAQIISMSLNNQILKDIDSIQHELGFSGRSEAIRAGIRTLLTEHKQKEKMNGIIEAALIVVHNEEESDEVSAIRHNYQHIIKTQIHNHLESHKCLEIFVLHGDAKKVKELLRAFEKNTKVELVKSIIV